VKKSAEDPVLAAPGGTVEPADEITLVKNVPAVVSGVVRLLGQICLRFDDCCLRDNGLIGLRLGLWFGLIGLGLGLWFGLPQNHGLHFFN